MDSVRLSIARRAPRHATVEVQVQVEGGSWKGGEAKERRARPVEGVERLFIDEIGIGGER